MTTIDKQFIQHIGYLFLFTFLPFGLCGRFKMMPDVETEGVVDRSNAFRQEYFGLLYAVQFLSVGNRVTSIRGHGLNLLVVSRLHSSRDLAVCIDHVSMAASAHCVRTIPHLTGLAF